MSWDYGRAVTRIDRFLAEAPSVTVERFDEGLGPRINAMRERLGQKTISTKALYDLPAGVAVIADTVHVYVNLLNYDNTFLAKEADGERTHARSLAFLHLHYAALDRVVDDLGAQRVDFHGARMHAVITDPTGVGGAAERVARALRLAVEMMDLSAAANRTLYRGEYGTKFRIGIDSGNCVAIDSGRQDEKEPLFVGSPANHAAKLADGETPGIFLSPRVRAIFGFGDSKVALREVREATSAEVQIVLNADTRRRTSSITADAEARLERWQADIREHRANTATASDFLFHKHELPLRSLKYSDLMPSNSILMHMVSIFADIDGYTSYIDNAVLTNSVADAVRNLHVIRNELNAVVQDDFDGRKVRFVGDCIHGVIAEGEGHDVDLTDSVDTGAQCAGAIRSSFEICRARLPGIDALGIAIGFELGNTPISRVGIRGERAVRVATSRATIDSEACQSACNGEETMIGGLAFQQASYGVRALFPNRVAIDLSYDDVSFQAPGSPITSTVTEPLAQERSHSEA